MLVIASGYPNSTCAEGAEAEAPTGTNTNTRSIVSGPAIYSLPFGGEQRFVSPDRPVPLELAAASNTRSGKLRAIHSDGRGRAQPVRIQMDFESDGSGVTITKAAEKTGDALTTLRFADNVVMTSVLEMMVADDPSLAGAVPRSGAARNTGHGHARTRTKCWAVLSLLACPTPQPQPEWRGALEEAIARIGDHLPGGGKVLQQHVGTVGENQTHLKCTFGRGVLQLRLCVGVSPQFVCEKGHQVQP